MIAEAEAPAENGRGRPREGSLVRRLIALAAGWILVALILTGAVLTTFFKQAALMRFQDGVAEIAEGLLAGTTVSADGKVTAPDLIDARSLRTYSGTYWQIAEPTPAGIHPLSRSRSLWDADLDGPPKGLEQAIAKLGKPVFYDAVGPDGRPLRAVAIVALLPERTEPLIFMAAQDRTPVDQDARRFATLTWIALLLLGGGLVAAVLLQVRVGLSPLFDLGRAIAQVRQGKTQRLTGVWPREIAPLAGELNALLDHNQEVVERQRTHVGNLAHALKTPISVMLAETERHPGELAEVVSRQAAAMRGHVDHHLRRARAAARAQTAGERTLIEPVMDELAVTLERVFQDKGVVIDWRAPEDLWFRGERQDFLEIAGNIMENAGKWCRGRVRADATPSGPGRLTLTVEDDGPGLPADRRDQALKRGARLDESAPGSGLGLSIVDELVRAYGGRLTLGDASMGGLKVVVELPAAET
ncbi:sensor histidine kinase [Caulobacter sp. 17J65-9]|uniref:ATP-binding protein n=1 Tax=Caulobacter sp. 17J65-9 TaxID=2709382 RepID=UPI001969FE6D|nr:sensor histidine kinase [Caulobacter sp. 17J65-9]